MYRKRDKGFSLLELLVVIVIISILFTFTTLAIRGTSPEELIQTEAERLDRLLQLALEEAILKGQEYGLEFKPDSYRFLLYFENTWQPLVNDDLLRERQLPQNMEFELEIEQIEVLVEKDSADADKKDEENPIHRYLFSPAVKSRPISMCGWSCRVSKPVTLFQAQPMASTRRKSVTCNTARRCEGFTLLEVLVALTIVALALGALISTSGSHASSAGYLKQKTVAHWVAMNEITRLQVEKAWPGKGDTKGSTAMAGAEWYWTLTVNETEDDDSRQVEYRIYLDEDREYSLTRLVGYLSKPDATTALQP